mgnify:CR=1 FL=1
MAIDRLLFGENGLAKKQPISDATAEALSDAKDDITNSMQATHGENSKTILRYPLDLSDDESNEVMRFNIKNRKSLGKNQKTIFLYTPSGITSADSASYSTSNLGFVGGALVGTGNAMKPVTTVAGENAPGIGKQVLDNLGGIRPALEALVTAGSQKFNTKLGDTFLMGSGIAANPLTNIQFEGVGMRSFTFTYKLVAESRKEAIEIRQIENTFRKFLYPLQQKSGVVLEYPPYWQIQFMKFGASAMEENKYLPFIDLCYLRNISCTYNASSNAFHLDGVPIEMDMSLTFDEAQQNTRGDLYQSPEDYDKTDYTYERIGLPDVADAVGLTENFKKDTDS